MPSESQCLRCGGPLEEGFIPEHTRHGLGGSLWVAGRPERSFWTGVKTNDRRRFRVATYRCQRCGRLESFAREEAT